MPPPRGQPITVDASIDPYATLGVTRTASADEIRAAWKKAVLRNHPDKVGDDGTLFRRVQSAYDMLRVEAKKSPRERKRGQRRREYEARRRKMEQWRAEEQAARAAEFAEKRSAAEQVKEQMREQLEKERKAKQQADRRIVAEGRSKYEARMAREQHEAYLAKCQAYDEAQKAKRQAYKQQQGKTWADKQQERHNERFHSRLRRYHQQAFETETKAEPEEPKAERAAAPAEPGEGSHDGANERATGAGLEASDSATPAEEVQPERQKKERPWLETLWPGGPSVGAAPQMPPYVTEPTFVKRSWLPWEAHSTSEPTSIFSESRGFGFHAFGANQSVWDRRRSEQEAVRRNFVATASGLRGAELSDLSC